ncbi:MAG: endonuclease [Elusimicrobiota bacterium]|jgi:hypothetical protein
MHKGPLFRGTLTCSLAFMLQGAAFGQTIMRAAPAAPITPVAVPVAHKASFLTNLALTGAITFGSLQQSVIAPSVGGLGTVPTLPESAIEAEAPPRAQAYHVDGTAWQGRQALQAAVLPETLPSQTPGKAVETFSQDKSQQSELPGIDRRKGGRSDFKHSKAARAMESALAEGGKLFDGSRDHPQTEAEIVKAQAQTPSQAAGNAETASLSGSALLASAHEISGRGFHVKSYDEARDYMYSVADHVEQQGRTGILDAYSGAFLPGRGGDGGSYKEGGDQNGDGYTDHGVNAEHIWPQSFFDRGLPMRSDLHHLMATLEHPNSIRSNYPFGEIKTDRPEYSNKGGAKMDQGVFEPPDFTKGRVARAAFYFYARYNDKRIFMGAAPNFWTRANIEILLRWNKEFPPSQFEQDRNDLVQRWQGNRNPFIDDPSLADRIGADAFLGVNVPMARRQSEPAEVHGRERREPPDTPEAHPQEAMGRSKEQVSTPVYGQSRFADDFSMSRGADDGNRFQGRKHGKRWDKRHKNQGRRDRNHAYAGR